MRILFLNHKKQQCGVYQYGLRLYNILKKTEDIEYIYEEIESYEEYNIMINYYSNNIYAIIYNFHEVTMEWLNNNTIQKSNIINIGIPHESRYIKWDIYCNIDPTIPESNNIVSLPRPIFENVDNMLLNYKYSRNTIKEFIEYKDGDVPIFGSFGFGFNDKNFDKIIETVNNAYDNAIIKLVITCADFAPNNEMSRYIADINKKCFNINLKSSVKLLITHEFFSNEEILLFLRSNTMNIFLYSYAKGRSISSVLDYALSVNTPLYISDSIMFNHLDSKNYNCNTISIHDSMKFSKEYYNIYRNKYSHINVINKFRDILLKPNKI
jgi:hypothetical protein